MSEINYYSAAAFTNNVAVARREDVEAALADLRAALAKAEAERDAEKSRATELEDALDLAHDEFHRIEHLTSNAEIHTLCWRGRQNIRQNVHVIVQRDRAQSERDALKQDIEDRDRAIESLRLKVDTAHGQIDALKARTERLAAYVKAIHAREDAVEPNEYEDPHGEKWRRYSDLWNVREAARAAVDAEGDLEATP